MKTYDTLDMIKDFEVAFFPMRGDEIRLRGFRELIVKSLRAFSSEVIKSASERLIQTRKSKTFPALAEILEACAKENQIYNANSSKGVPEAEMPGHAAAQWIFREEQFRALSRQRHTLLVEAAQGNWIGGLFSYYMKVGRLPLTGPEIEACQREAREFEATYEDTIRTARNHGSLGKQLERLGEQVRNKSEALRGLLLS